MRKATPLLLLDLDGAARLGPEIIERPLRGAEDVFVPPSARLMIQRWVSGGGRVAGFSFHPGVSLGTTHYVQVEAVEAATLELLPGLEITRWCIHHPGSSNPDLTVCSCRRPLPGLLIQLVEAMEVRHADEFYPATQTLVVGSHPQTEEMAKAVDLDFEPTKTWLPKAAETSGVPSGQPVLPITCTCAESYPPHNHCSCAGPDCCQCMCRGRTELGGN